MLCNHLNQRKCPYAWQCSTGWLFCCSPWAAPGHTDPSPHQVTSIKNCTQAYAEPEPEPEGKHCHMHLTCMQACLWVSPLLTKGEEPTRWSDLSFILPNKHQHFLILFFWDRTVFFFPFKIGPGAQAFPKEEWAPGWILGFNPRRGGNDAHSFPAELLWDRRVLRVEESSTCVYIGGCQTSTCMHIPGLP